MVCSGGEGVPVSLTLSPAELRELLASTQGVVLPGSPADVDPTRYGADRDPATSTADPAREAVDYALLEDAIENHKPVLGICFGVQSMNVWRGGTLVQDLAPVPVNHAAGAQVAVAHTALVAKDSLLGSLADPAEAHADGDYLRLPINSSHHQAIAAPGDGLRIAARSSEDGVIEAVELDPGVFHVEHSARQTFLLGVQWHPERSVATSATSRNLFQRLVEEARKADSRG